MKLLNNSSKNAHPHDENVKRLIRGVQLDHWVKSN